MTAKFSTTRLGEEETKIYNSYNKSLDYYINKFQE